MVKTTDANGLGQLAQGLAAVAARLEPKEEAALCKEAAATITLAMVKTTDANGLGQLAQGLAAVAARLEPKEAREAATTITRATTKMTKPMVQGLASLASSLGPREAREAAAAITRAMTQVNDQPSAPSQPDTFKLAAGLAAVLTRETPEVSQRRSQSVAASSGPTRPSTSSGPAPPTSQPALEPPPDPLPPQLLVDLLRQPLCVGEARRVVLEQLARHYRRAFADQWEFVRFAQEQKLGLDLTTPPQRPGSLAADP
jgi:hypothetical protein